jgi:hypothetical protein
LVTFFRRRERKLLACRATPGLRPLQRHASNYKNNSCLRLPLKPKTPKNPQGAILCLSAICACCVPSRGPTGRCLRIPVGCLQSAEAGTRPGGRPPFLCATRKEAPIRAPQSAAPAGHTCAGVLAGCAVELTARLRRSVRTTTASQWTKRVCPAAHPPPRKHPAAGAARRGGDGSGHRCARPRVRRRKRHALASQAERSAGVADSRVAFLLGTFLWRSKEQVPRPPGRDPASALSKAHSHHKALYGIIPPHVPLDRHPLPPRRPRVRA